MRIRDDLELSFLAETGDPALAEIVGIVWQQTYETICDICGIPAEALDELDGILGGLDL